VYAVRPGSNFWIVFLDGGSLCSTYADCAQRWCGDPPYDRTDMSSVGAPAQFAEGGLLSQDPENPFVGATAVYLHYCSSDTWVGAAAEAVRLMDTSDTGQDYAIRFNGADIVDAVLAEILAEHRRPELAELPPAADIEQFFFGGGSAGAIGAVFHADSVRDRVLAVAPSADVRLAVDGGLSPGIQASDDPWGEAVPGPMLDQVQLWMGAGDRVDEAFGPRKWDARLDASCLANHPGEEWWCVDPAHVLLHEIATPFALVQDQLDPVWFSTLDDLIDGGDGPQVGAMTADIYARSVRDLAAAMIDIGAAVGLTEYPLDGPLPAVFAPRCQLHDSYARNSAHFQEIPVPTEADGEMPMAPLWWAFFEGTGADDAVEPEDGTPDCP
jgi:hypothetical protein